MTAEQCRLCADPELLLPGETIPLCRVHWSGWLARFLNSDVAPPCGARLIQDGDDE